MSFDLNGMVTQRAHLAATAQCMYKDAQRDGRQPDAEEKRNFDVMMTEVDRLDDDITRLKRLAAVQKSLSASTGNPLHRERPGRTPDGSYRNSPYELKGEAELRACSAYFRGDDSPEWRALQSDVNPSGGYMVPQKLSSDIIQAVDNLVFIRQKATKHTLTESGSLGIVSLDTDPADPTWTTELGTGADDTAMAFGQRTLTPHALAQRIKVSEKLLRLAPNAAQIVTERLAYKLSSVFERAYMVGTGAFQPLGVFTASSNGISTGRDVSTGNTSTAITMEGLINALYTLKGQYQTSPTTLWCFHRDALKQIRKLRDDSGAGAGTGQFLWQPSTQLGQPDMLLGIPVHSSEYVPNTFTTGLYVGVLGDWKHYAIADLLTMTIKRLDELYAETAQVGFISRLESDGMPILEEAFVRVKLA